MCLRANGHGGDTEVRWIDKQKKAIKPGPAPTRGPGRRLPERGERPVMDETVLAWLLAQLGTSTDTADLENRYTRLGSARAVALEILAERRAKLLADPLRLTVDGVVTMDSTNNLTGTERQITAVTGAIAPDDALSVNETAELVVAPLLPVRRTR